MSRSHLFVAALLAVTLDPLANAQLKSGTGVPALTAEDREEIRPVERPLLAGVGHVRCGALAGRVRAPDGFFASASRGKIRASTGWQR